MCVCVCARAKRNQNGGSYLRKNNSPHYLTYPNCFFLKNTYPNCYKSDVPFLKRPSKNLSKSH